MTRVRTGRLCEWTRVRVWSFQPTAYHGSMFDRITFDPAIMGGRACIRGMRIPVSAILGQIAHGASIDDVLAGYPDLSEDDVRTAIEYAEVYPV